MNATLEQLKKMELSELLDILVTATNEYKRESKAGGSATKLAELKKLIDKIQLIAETKKTAIKR